VPVRRSEVVEARETSREWEHRASAVGDGSRRGSAGGREFRHYTPVDRLDRTDAVEVMQRLAIVTIRLLPLRERLDDLPPLARHFTERWGAASPGTPAAPCAQ
jgi:hypothetical protein